MNSKLWICQRNVRQSVLIAFVGLYLIEIHINGIKCNLADFTNNRTVTTIAFGSCNKFHLPQPLWRSVIKENPDLWIWLGDAVYADTRVAPFVWMISKLPVMQKRYEDQKHHPEYQLLVQSNISVLGTWDDHDYGSDNGGKTFQYRLQSENIFLDFLDEPLDSKRRVREGVYASYSYGTGNKIVKIILLDVRSHSDRGHVCDMLGSAQWEWFEKQLEDNTPSLFVIGSGMQILSDIPFIDKWQSCPASLDRLVWLTQKKSRVVFLSGDVHFAEVNCMNATSSGYPLYEATSSALTHSCSTSALPYGVCDWTLKKVVASCFRISNVITKNNFGILRIDWNSPVHIYFEIHSVDGIVSTVAISLDDLERRRYPSRCPPAIEQPNWYWKRVFWCSVVIGAILVALFSVWLCIKISRWFVREVLKDLDVKIKNGLIKLRTKDGKSKKN